MGSCAAILLAGTLAAAPPLSPAEIRSGLELLAATGELSSSELTRLLARSGAASVEAPSRLGCATSLLVRVRPWVRDHGGTILLNTMPFEGYFDSTRFPIRVHYQTKALIAVAQTTLAAADEAWQAEVVELGFNAPYAMDDDDQVVPGLYVYVVDSYQYAGFAEPLADVPSTPACDCAVRVIINGTINSDQIASTMYHEFNHATQAATDCAESPSAWENFATAVQFSLGGRTDSFIIGMIREFQRYPDYSLDYVNDDGSTTGPTNDYDYGSCLFPLYLLDRFGAGDPRFLREVWDSFAENGTMSFGSFGSHCSTGNVPDWFQGLDTVLRQRGSSLDDAFSEFSAWRAVVGERDDLAHFRNGALLPEPTIERTITEALPAHGTALAHEYASRYFLIQPAGGLPAWLQVKVVGSPEARWSGSLLAWRPGLPVACTPLEFSAATGTAGLSTFGVSRVELVASQIADNSHSTDAKDFQSSRSFSYEIEGWTPAAGCGCSASDARPTLAPFLLLGAALLLRGAWWSHLQRASLARSRSKNGR